MPSLDQARAAKEKVREVYGRLADVNGIGIARMDGGYGIKVNLRRQPSPDVSLPSTVQGVPVQVQVVGVLRRF